MDLNYILTNELLKSELVGLTNELLEMGYDKNDLLQVMISNLKNEIKEFKNMQ